MWALRTTAAAVTAQHFWNIGYQMREKRLAQSARELERRRNIKIPVWAILPLEPKNQKTRIEYRSRTAVPLMRPVHNRELPTIRAEAASAAGP